MGRRKSGSQRRRHRSILVSSNYVDDYMTRHDAARQRRKLMCGNQSRKEPTTGVADNTLSAVIQSFERVWNERQVAVYTEVSTQTAARAATADSRGRQRRQTAAERSPENINNHAEQSLLKKYRPHLPTRLSPDVESRRRTAAPLSLTSSKRSSSGTQANNHRIAVSAAKSAPVSRWP